MAVCWEQEQSDGKAVTSSTSEVVSEITLNPEVMQIPPAPEESGYQNVAALVGSSAIWKLSVHKFPIRERTPFIVKAGRGDQRSFRRRPDHAP